MRIGDLDALKKTLGSSSYWRYTHEYGDVILVSWVMSAIDNAPTVPLPDFKEGYKQAIIDGKTNFSRPQGEWKVKALSTFPQYQPDEYICPFCNTIVNYKTNFCSNCGADMRKEGTE